MPSGTLVKGIFAAGILILAVALFIPTFVDTTQGNATQVLELDNGSSVELTDKLSVGAVTVSNTGNNATIEYTDETSLATNQTLLNVSESGNMTLSGDYVNVTLDSIPENETVRITSTYPPMFGWNAAARTFINNSEIILVMLAGITVLAFAGKMAVGAV